MSTSDTCCSIVPQFRVLEANRPAFEGFCEQFVALAQQEPGCLYYGFLFDGEQVRCREGYADAEALLAHVQRVGPLLKEALKVASLVRLEIHGPEAELARLREPLAGLKPQFFTLTHGFRR